MPKVFDLIHLVLTNSFDVTVWQLVQEFQGTLSDMACITASGAIFKDGRGKLINESVCNSSGFTYKRKFFFL